MAFRLRSPVFRESASIPIHHTCAGADRSPPLAWDDAPADTQSFALIVEDIDAPGGVFTHWVLFDIPAEVNELPEGDPVFGIAGVNDFQRPGYSGPCPPPRRGDHRYIFTLYALDAPSLDLSQRATRREVESAMEGHILKEARLMGRYERL